MNSYLLDTSIIIDYLRGKKEAVILIDSLSGSLCSSYICLAEFYEGLYRIPNRKEQEAAVITFFSSLDVIYGIDGEVAHTFGKLRARLKGSGTIIEDFDLLLAATAIVNSLTLITFNKKHFAHIEELKLYNR